MPKENKNDGFTELTQEEMENSTVFSKPNTEYKKPKDKSLHIWLKTAIALVTVALLIFLIIFINKNYGKKAGSSGSVSSAVSSSSKNYVEKAKTDDIKTVTVKNENGTFKMSKTVSDDETLWYVDGIDKKYCDTSAVSQTVENCAKIEVITKQSQNIGYDYGLKEPLAKVTVESKDKKYSFTVGKTFKNSDMTGAYIKFSDDESVYLVSSAVAENYNFKLTGYIDINAFTKIEQTDENEDYFGTDGLTKFDYIDYKGSMVPGGEVRLLMYGRNNSTQLYKMEKPYNLNIDQEKITDILAILKNNTETSEAYYYNKNGIPESVINEYSLNSPDAVMNYKVGKEVFTIKLKQSKKDDFYYSMTVNDTPIIYKVPAKTFSFLELSVEEMATDTVILENLDGLDSMTITANNKAYKFNISTKSKTTSDGETEDEIIVKHNNKTIDTDNFTNYYYYIMAIGPYVTNRSLLNERPAGVKEYFTLKFTPKKSVGDKELELKVYKTDNSKRYYLELDGNPIGLCKTEYADMVYDHINDLLTGVTLKAIS